MPQRECKCGRPTRRGQRYCNECHAAYMREWRQAYRDLTPEQKMKDIARSYANVYLRRGKLEKQPCEKCGEKEVQMHHDDYTKPLEVRWLCAKCHVEHHAAA